MEDMLTIPDELYFKYLVASSGKLCMLDRILKLLLPQGHKVAAIASILTQTCKPT